MTSRRTKAQRVAEVAGRIDYLVNNFDTCLNAFIKDPPFTAHGQYGYHARTIELRRRFPSVVAAISADEFTRSLYDTLQAWKIGQRQSKLVPYTEFVSVLQHHEEALARLNDMSIAKPSHPDLARETICELVHSLPLVRNIVRVVPNTKALHHLLPDLVVPYDREYSRRFFCHENSLQQNPNTCYREAYDWFKEIALRVELKPRVTGNWNSSITKVIDNAIVGFFVYWIGEAKKGRTS